MNKKSITKNYIINLFRTLMTIIFPIITFPYASRVLGADGIGKVNFANSIISYFLLLSSLGISTYAIKEGVKYRNDTKKFSKFCTEILLINIISTTISYILLLITIILFQNVFETYNLLILIVSISIMTTTLNIEWFYNIIEDYTYITLRSVFFQLISLIALFVFVKSKNDYYIYALITVLSSTGSCIFNLIHSKKYITLFKRDSYNLTKHLKPILIIFGTSIAATIYLNIDTTMIGLLKNDREVGLYTSAIKINKMICTLISSICTVILPRLSYYIFNKQNDEFVKLCNRAANLILIISIPAAFGLYVLSPQIIELFSGNEFQGAQIISKILAPNLIFSTLNGFISYQIFLPMNKENYALYATISGALIDCVFNYIFIPQFGALGAASATLFAEFIVFIFSIFMGRKLFNFKNTFNTVYQYILASIPIIVIYCYINQLNYNIFITIFVTVIFSILIYFSLLIIFRNKYVNEIMYKYIKRI